MKRIIILFFAVISTFTAYSQTYIQDGDNCFNSGDYACAISNYDNAFKNASGKDKQITEIKLTRARWCAEHIKNANQLFAAKNYTSAKEEYQKVLDSNPKDRYAQSQIVKCDNAGEDKPQGNKMQATNLRLSKSTLYFTSNGGTSEKIIVHSGANTYSVPSAYVPSWCTVKTYDGYFTVIVSTNPNYTSRIGWIKVTAGGKEVRMKVEQSARTNSKKQTTTQSNAKKCFSCPKTNDTWGLTLGYAQQTVELKPMEVIQLGLKVEPLFRYGFGLNTGINLLGYSENLFDAQLFKYGFDAYAINIPLHLEYRLNFSKWFNIFAYGGVGFNAMTNSNFTNYTLPITFEYGGGFRISHVQFNVGSSLYLGNLRNTQDFGKNTKTYQKLNFSISYMF